MRILTHLRNDLLLQCSEMDSAHRNHNPGAGNENNTASQRVNMIVTSTKDDISQVLRELDAKLVQQTVRTPNTFAPPSRGNYQELYTSLGQFHPVRPPTYSNSQRTQQIPHTGGTMDRNIQESHTPRGRQPNYFTQAIAPRQPDVRATHHAPTPSSGIDHRRRSGTNPAFIRPTERQPPQLTQQVSISHPTPDVFLKRSTATSTAHTLGEKWHRSTTNYPQRTMGDGYIGERAPTMTKPQQVATRQILRTDQRGSPNTNAPSAPDIPQKERRLGKKSEDILRCHLCRHINLWGTWPVIQAHYRDNHGYTPQRNSSPSPSSSPEPAQPRKKYNKHTPTPDKTGAQQNRGNANQSDTGVSNIRTGYNERGPQMENPSLLHTHRVRTQAERKIYQNDVGPTKTISTHTYRKSQSTQLYKSTKAIQARLDDPAPTVTNGGMATTIQRLGSLNFPPINPQNATEAYDKKETQPKEVVILEVEDIPTDVQRDEQAMDDNHKTHQTSTENPMDAHTTGDLYRGQSIANKSVTSTMTSNPIVEPNNTGLTHTESTPKPSTSRRKPNSLWDSTGALAELARRVSGVAQIPGIDAPQTPPDTSKMDMGAVSTPENPKANNGSNQGPCKTADHHVPQQIGEQVHLASWHMTSKYTEYNAQPPQKNPYDMDNRSIRVEVRTAADPEKAICSAIMLGKVDATGSYNVDGHAASIEELQERLRNLRDQR